MSATKILWGQIITVFLIVLAGVWGATQWTASALAYQPELGRPWFVLADIPIYPPPAFFWWWFSFDAYAPRIFLTGAYIAASGGVVSIAVAIGMSVWRARELKNAETYGSARWATEREVRAAGLLEANGVVLGMLAADYLRHDGPEHVLCFAPTRSGKGVGLVVPSLFRHAWSVCLLCDPFSSSSFVSQSRTNPGNLTLNISAANCTASATSSSPTCRKKLSRS